MNEANVIWANRVDNGKEGLNALVQGTSSISRLYNQDSHIEQFKLEQVQRVNGEPGLERTHPVAFLVRQKARSYCD